MSRFNTYGLDTGYQDIMYKVMLADGELSEDLERKLEINEKNFEFMCSQVKKFSKYAEGEISLIDAEIKRLQNNKKMYQIRVEKNKELIVNSMNLRGIERFKNDDVNIYPTTRKVVEVDEDVNHDNVPIHLTEITVKIDKKKIKEYLEDGNEIEGIRIGESTSYTIK